MVIDPETGCVQPGDPAVVILIRLKTVVDVYVLVIVAVPAALKTIVWFGPPLMLYVTVAFGVPVKVTVADCPGQIVVLAEMVTVGGGMTVITTVPVTGRVQAGVPPEVMLTRLNTVVAVYVLVIVAVPAAFKTIVWLGPPLML